MQSNPRILVNLLVILVKILVNLLVKLTKLGQGGHGGGSPPSRASPRLVFPPKEGVPTGLQSGIPLGGMGTIPKGLDPRGQTTSYWLRLLARLLAIGQTGSTIGKTTGNISQTIGNVIGNWLDHISFLPILRTFSGSLLVNSRILFTWLLLIRVHVFFPGIVLRRNQIIKEVVPVEASSILPLPRRLESCQDKFSWLDVFEQCSSTNRNLSR